MRDTMGLLRTTIAIENPLKPGTLHELPDTLVDTGAELSWVPRAVLESLGISPRKRVWFEMADGSAIERDIGFAMVYAGGAFTNDLDSATAGTSATICSRLAAGVRPKTW